MTMNISPVSQTAPFVAKPWFAKLTKFADRLWTLAAPQLKSKHRTEEAIEILRNPSASPDVRDWAERYLCGMEGPDEKRYCEGRRWQS